MTDRSMFLTPEQVAELTGVRAAREGHEPIGPAEPSTTRMGIRHFVNEIDRVIVARGRRGSLDGRARRLAASTLPRRRFFEGSTMTKEILTSDECAQLLRCTTAQIEELAHVGEIPGVKLGRSWLFMRSDLLIFLAEKARADAAARRAGRGPDGPAPIVRPKRPGSTAAPPVIATAQPSALPQVQPHEPRLLLTAAAVDREVDALARGP